MFDEIKSRDENILELSEKIKTTLDKYAKSKRKQQDLELCKDRVQEMENQYDGFKLAIAEMKQHFSPADKKIYHDKVKTYKETLKQFKNDIQWKETDGVSAQLLSGPNAQSQFDTSTGDGLMKHGLAVQDESKASLERSSRAIQDSLMAGKDIAVKLDQQTEQLSRMADNLDEISDTLTRSVAIVKAMARKAATDKYLWCLIFLVLAAIIFIVAWKATR